MRRVLGLAVNNPAGTWGFVLAKLAMFTQGCFDTRFFARVLPSAAWVFDLVFGPILDNLRPIFTSGGMGFAIASTGPVVVTTSFKRKGLL